jgi:hypothetical protein
MKTKLSFAAVFFFLIASQGAAQVTVPANPGRTAQRSLGGNGGTTSSAGISGGGVKAAKPVVVQYVAVTPVESWANSAGKVMEARLLAFSVPAPGETGPVEIIRQGKVRFLVTGGKAPVEYPLDQLGEAEQAKIRALAEQAAKGAPPEAK